MSCESLHVVLLANRVEADDDDTVRSLAMRLRVNGLRVRILCISSARRGDAGIPTLTVPGLAHPWTRPWAVRNLALTGELGATGGLLHVLSPELADAGLAVAEHWRLPYVVTVDDFPSALGRIRTSRRWCRRIIATGSDLANEMIQQFGIPEALIEVVPPGVPLPVHQAAPLGSGRVPVVGTAGSLAQDVGVSTFLDAARHVIAAGVDAEFVVAGHGHDEGNVRRVAAHIGLAERVTFVEDRGDLGRYWQALDLYCQSSLVPSAGRLLSGALAHGLPAVVSQVPGLREWIIPEETGLLVPPGDPNAIASTVLSLLADPSHARRLGSQARAWIAQHRDPNREAKALTHLYEGATNTQAPSSPTKQIRRDTASPRP
jgi:glycosyltransferase involved in cell wall biosynthesis